jgi:glycosyltransferase involved in cell wall biosynthesis
MYADRKVVVVMPAYNAEATLRRTYDEVMAHRFVDLVIVVDDNSDDRTTAVARSLPNTLIHEHERRLGYGANQKTCYRLALEHGADIVVMVHPDYQYTPALLPALVSLIVSGEYACVLGSRILGGRARDCQMPWWRYLANRVLTTIDNVLMGAKLSDFHTGYRAYSRELLLALTLDGNSDDYVFDNQILAQVLWHRFRIGEVSCPARYTAESSSISFRRSVVYGFGCIATAIIFRLARAGLLSSRLFEPLGPRA